MIQRDTFIEHLSRALYHLYEPDRLAQNPLAAIFGVANRPDTFAVLQRILIEGIQALEPSTDDLHGSPGWEVYEPLFHRFVQQLDQEQVARQLGMSVRHLRRKEHAAIEALAAQLWQQYHLGDEVMAQAEAERPLTTSPSMAQELAWLRDAPPERPVDLDRLLPDTLALAAPLARRYGVQLELTAAADLPAIPVHEIALSQLLLNLLGMAIPCAEGGAISLAAHALSDEVVIRICSDRPARAGRPDGAAQAPCLDVATHLAQLCYGRLTVTDQADGFSATLTLPGIGQLLVLVVDDNADTLQLVRRYAIGTRYRVVAVQDPAEVSGLAERLRPAIVVLDVMMPHVDGWRLLAELRQQPWADETAFIICTILPQHEIALALGADGFLQKPITREAFLSALDRQIEPMAPESR